jgi:hypothetical protein
MRADFGPNPYGGGGMRFAPPLRLEVYPMRFLRTLFGVAMAASLTLSTAYADSHAAQPHRNKPSTAGKPTTSGKPSSGATTSGSGTTNTTSTGSNSANTAQLNPIAAKISSHPQLKNKITAMLPIDPTTGKTMTLNQASMGFKNQGQFIAALHVSQNLGISFTDLKSHMVTTSTQTQNGQTTQTMQQTGSLGPAIQAVKKTADATTEAQKAETQANYDVTSTNTTTTSTSTSPIPKNKKKTTHATAAQ